MSLLRGLTSLRFVLLVEVYTCSLTRATGHSGRYIASLCFVFGNLLNCALASADNAEPLGERVAEDRGMRAGARGSPSPKNIKGASSMENGASS